MLDISRRLTDDEIREVFLSPMVTVTESNAAIALRFEVTRARREEEACRLALAEATRERDEALRTVKALTPAANYCLEYKPLLLKAERERDEAVRILRDIATFGWYAKGAKVARAYLAAREGR